MTIIYGIHNCDTVKKAQKWLNNHEVTFQFHDFRKDGITQELVQEFLSVLPLEQLINKRSTTYRQLDEQTKQNLSVESALPLLLEQPTLIKRPVLVNEQQYLLGFKDSQYQEFFS